MTTARYLSAAFALTVWSFSAAAQPAPQRTSATYEDWVVRCETRPGPPVQKNCEMVQFTQVQGQSSVLTQVAIGKPVKGEPLKVVIQVPIGAWLPTGVRIQTNDRAANIAGSFKRCIPTACFADTEIKDDVVRRYRAMSEAGKLQFKDGAQKDVSLPLSFKGFSAAYDALARE